MRHSYIDIQEREKRMEKHSVAFKEMIYDLMNGQIDLEKYPAQESNIVKNEFEKGMPCDVCYEQVYEANKRLCERLGVEAVSYTHLVQHCMILPIWRHW